MKKFAECSHCFSLNSYDSTKISDKKPVCGKCANPLSLHSLVSAVNTGNFQKILAKSDNLVIVDFWASWCGPCRQYGPEFEKASLQEKSAQFLKINTEAEQIISSQLGIQGIPCTIVFKNGKEVQRQAGAMSSSQVAQLIKGNL